MASTSCVSIYEHFDSIASEFHLCIFAEADGDATRIYSDHLKEAEAALVRGEPPPDDPLPGVTVERSVSS